MKNSPLHIRSLFSHRQHPIKILGYTTKSFWLLLIPLARSLIAMRFDIATWLKGWWLDILVILVIFAYAVLRWFFVTFKIEKDHIEANTGYFGLCKTSIPYSKLCTICASQGVLYRPFRAYKVYFDTNSGSRASSDIVLSLKKSDYERLFAYFPMDEKGRAKFTHAPERKSVLIFSLLFSSTLSGVILFTTLIIEVSRIVGRELEERFISTVNEYMQKFAIKLPRYVVAFAMVIILSWLYSFMINVFRHWSFTVTRQGDKFIIKSGFVSKRYHIISAEKINYIDIEQSFLMKIFNICSVHIHCSGYGKGRREIAVLIPITTFSQVQSSLSLLMPETPIPDLMIRPNKKDIKRFLFVPSLLCLIVPIADFVLIRLFPGWREVIRFSAIMCVIPFAWLLAVKIAAGFVTGTGEEKKWITLSYCQVYRFHYIIVNKNKISKVTYFQTPFQRRADVCNLRINTFGESICCHSVKHLPLKEAENFVDDCGILS